MAVDDIATGGWEQQAEILSRAVAKAEILSRAVAKAESIFEVPVSYYGRSYGEGKKIRAHHAISVIWTIFARRLLR